MKYLLPLFLLLLLCIPLASAETYQMEDTPGFDEYIVTNSLSDLWIVTDKTVIDNDAYDSMITASSDEIYFLEFELRGIKEDSQMPVHFWYDQVNSTQLNFNFYFQNESFFLFWTKPRMYASITDTSGNTYLTEELSQVSSDCRITINEENIKVGNSELNTTLIPTNGLTFDMSLINFMSEEELPGRGGYGYATLRIQDADYSNDITGPLHYIYELIDFADSDRTLYQMLLYIQIILRYMLFTIDFFLSSFWHYVAIAQCGSLFWGILHKNQGVARMIQKYIEAFGYFMKLPFLIFKFTVEFVFSIANRLIPG
jgi:hypothetical protein